ncbi:hypothetical protein EWZ74_03345 [Helicobacter pylori]|nr:hypothetical protein [Helicobacter pylori]
MNGEFWRKGFSFNTNAFFADKNHQTNSSFSALASIYCSLYESGVMLDKVTKACYNFCSFVVKFLKGFCQSYS